MSLCRLSEESDCNVQSVTIDWVELKCVSVKKNRPCKHNHFLFVSDGLITVCSCFVFCFFFYFFTGDKRSLT